MIDWIKTWTFFNWLAVIAFVLALVGFLNSALSLRSRYKDWRGGQSQKAYEKRLNELLDMVYLVGLYRKKPTQYFFTVIYKSFYVLSFYLLAIAVFLGTSISTVLFPSYPLIIAGLAYCTILILAFISGYAGGALRIFRYVADPEQLGGRVRTFMEKGAKKKLLSEEKANEMVIALYLNNFTVPASHLKLLNVEGIKVTLPENKPS